MSGATRATFSGQICISASARGAPPSTKNGTTFVPRIGLRISKMAQHLYRELGSESQKWRNICAMNWAQDLTSLSASSSTRRSSPLLFSSSLSLLAACASSDSRLACCRSEWASASLLRARPVACRVGDFQLFGVSCSSWPRSAWLINRV